MKYNTLTIILVFFNFFSFSQIQFKTGYIVDSLNQKKQVYIKDKGWLYNPNSIEYQLTKESPVQIADPYNTLEMGIGDHTLMVSASVEIEASPDAIQSLDRQRNLTTQHQRVFLKTILRGTISLYEYTSTLNTRYYYQKDSNFFLLYYKKFLSLNGTVAFNEAYKSQLFSLLQCGFIPIAIKAIEYTLTDLKQVLVDYHNCANLNYNQFKEQKKPVLFSLAAGAGADCITPFVNKTRSNIFNLRPNIELEALLPINKYKWAICLEGSYQHFISHEAVFSTQSAKNQYYGFEMSLGLRHYIYLNSATRWIVQGSAACDIPIENKVIWTTNDPSSDNFITLVGNLATGLKLKNLSFLVKWYSTRNLNGSNLPQILRDQGGFKFGKISTYFNYSFPLFKKNKKNSDRLEF